MHFPGLTFCALVLLLVAVVVSNVQGRPEPLGRSNIRATHVPPNGDRRKRIVFPNTYYDIPKHRYPYYDAYGRGQLLYGYGGPTLYKYTVFKPSEGYFKWFKSKLQTQSLHTRGQGFEPVSSSDKDQCLGDPLTVLCSQRFSPIRALSLSAI